MKKILSLASMAVLCVACGFGAGFYRAQAKCACTADAVRSEAAIDIPVHPVGKISVAPDAVWIPIDRSEIWRFPCPIRSR